MQPVTTARSSFFAGAALAIGCWSPSAQAQDWNNAPQEQPRHDRDRVVVGMGVGYAPAYQGADDYRVLPVPVIDVVSGPFFANLRNGVGVNVIDTGAVTFGGSIAVMPGYRRRDAPDGIGKLSLGVGGRMFANVEAGGIIATLGATQGFAGGTKGVIADASLSYPVAVSSRLTLIPTIGATWADTKHNDRYFGVDAGQSLASGLPEFHAGKGFKDASALLTASYRLTDRINLIASGGVTTLLGDAKDSPIVYHKTQPAGFLSLAYRFD